MAESGHISPLVGSVDLCNNQLHAALPSDSSDHLIEEVAQTDSSSFFCSNIVLISHGRRLDIFWLFLFAVPRSVGLGLCLVVVIIYCLYMIVSASPLQAGNSLLADGRSVRLQLQSRLLSPAERAQTTQSKQPQPRDLVWSFTNLQHRNQKKKDKLSGLNAAGRAN